jgi:DNA-binding NarL/FixJ family response regulator
MAPRVLVVDDNPVVRSGLISLLEAAGLEVAGEAGDGRTAIELTERLRPDLVLLDVRMPVLDGVAAAKLLAHHTQVVMLTYTGDPETVRAAIGHGAVGYLVHGTFSAEELAAAVRTAVGGANPLSPEAVSALVAAVLPAPPPGPARIRERYGLSERESEVMDLIARGCSNTEVAGRLFLAEKTVKNHVNRIYAKLCVTSRGAAIARWLGTAGSDGGW